MTVTTLAPGDDVYLGSILCNVHCWGIISDLETPAMMSATFEILGNDGAITLDALVGPQGIPGQNAPIVDMQWDSITDVEDLPDNLTDDPVDVGKAWWIGNQVYVWDGEQYRIRAMGTQGPPGPVPNISPTMEVVTGDEDFVDVVEVSGTAAAPGWHFKINGETIRGPQGTNATIRDATDYDESVTGPPEVGQAIVWDGVNYSPQPLGTIVPKFFTIPEANFVNFTGIATRQQIAQALIPPQDFPWVPYVTGHLRAQGVEADADPLILGCEVRLGDPTTGQLVARGFGNSSTWTTIVPHVSMPGSPNDAITPDNNVAVVPPGSTGVASTLYVNLFNDGVAGAYLFNKKDAQLAVLCIPVGGLAPGS